MNRRMFLGTTSLALLPISLNACSSSDRQQSDLGGESRLLLRVDRDANLFIDGVQAGSVKAGVPQIFEVYPGTHIVRTVTADAAYVWEGRVTVRPGMQEFIDVVLLPSDPRVGVVGPEFVDPRDQIRYRTVTIKGVRWMAENLRYRTSRSWCYANREELGPKYGRLYHGVAALHAAPPGWRLPSKQEVEDLIALYGPTVYDDLMPGGKSNFNATLAGSCLMGKSGGLVASDTRGIDQWVGYFFNHPATAGVRGPQGWCFFINSTTKAVSIDRPAMADGFANLLSVRLVAV